MDVTWQLRRRIVAHGSPRLRGLVNRVILCGLLTFVPGVGMAESTMFKKGQSMGRIAMSAELCGLPRAELESRVRWLQNWISRLPAKDRDLYAVGVQEGSMEVRIGGLSIPCDTAVAEFRRRTKKLDY